jgi:hypothetical protein
MATCKKNRSEIAPCRDFKSHRGAAPADCNPNCNPTADNVPIQGVTKHRRLDGVLPALTHKADTGRHVPSRRCPEMMTEDAKFALGF